MAIKDLSFSIKIVFCISIAIVFSIEIFINNKLEPSSQGYIWGSLIEKIALAFITSLVFYFVNIQIKQTKEKRYTQKFIKEKGKIIIDEMTTMLQSMISKVDLKISSNYPNEDEVNMICQLLNPKEESPLSPVFFGKNVNWYHYFNRVRTSTQKNIDRIFNRISVIDPILVIIMTEIEDCEFFLDIDMIKDIDLGNKNLVDLKKQIYDYINKVHSLDNYFITNKM